MEHYWWIRTVRAVVLPRRRPGSGRSVWILRELSEILYAVLWLVSSEYRYFQHNQTPF